MRKPFSVYFREAQHSEGSPKATEIKLPANRKAQIQINRVMRLTHREYDLIANFSPAGPKSPKILSVDNRFYSHSRTKTASPTTNDNHSISDKGAYHIKGEEMRVRGQTYTIGYEVRTHDAGTYELEIKTITESGAARPVNGLKVIVE